MRTLYIDTEVFKKEEYLAVKNNLMDGKYVGPDVIAPEAIKYCKFDDIIFEHVNRLLIDGKKNKPIGRLVIPIPKAVNLNKVDNYGGNALSIVALKVTNKMILNRIQPFINPLLRNDQNGFRPGDRQQLIVFLYKD